MKIRGIHGHHGEYINDHWRVFSSKREITLDEARDLLRCSPYVDENLIKWRDTYLFMNKGWYIIGVLTNEFDEKFIRVLYLADGSYYIYEGKYEEVLEILNQWREVKLSAIEELVVW